MRGWSVLVSGPQMAHAHWGEVLCNFLGGEFCLVREVVLGGGGSRGRIIDNGSACLCMVR